MLLFEANKDLFATVVKPVAGLIVEGSGPNDPSRYLNLEFSGGKLSVYVVRQDMSALAVVDMPYPKESEGKAFALDRRLCSLLEKHKTLGPISVDLPMSSSAQEVDSEEDDTVKPLKPLGTMSCLVPSLVQNKKEIWSIPSWEHCPHPSMDTAGAKKMTLSAEKFTKFVRQVGFAAGEDGGNPKYCNILMRSSGADIDIVTFNLYGLARITDKHEGATEDFSIIAPYMNMSTVAKLLPDPAANVEMSYVKKDQGGAGYVIVSQSFSYGSNRITLSFRIACTATEPFRFEKTLKALDFKYCFTIKRDQALDLIDRVPSSKEDERMAVEIDPLENSLSVVKREKGGLALDGGVPLASCKSEKFAVVISKKMLQDCLTNTGANEIGVNFSGHDSLCNLVLDTNFMAYIQPFGPPKA